MILRPYSEAEQIQNLTNSIQDIPVDTLITGIDLSTITPIDQLDPSKATIAVPFGTSHEDVLELHISNIKDVLLESLYTVPFKVRNGIEVPPNRVTSNGVQVHIPDVLVNSQNSIRNIGIDLHKIFRTNGYISGKFKFQLNFNRNVFGTYSDRCRIVDISDDRTRISISKVGNFNLDSAPLVDSFGNRVEYYINLGDNKFSRVVSFNKNTSLTNSRETVYDIILQSELPSELGLSTTCWLVIQLADSQVDTIVVLPKQQGDSLNKLRNPDFSLETQYGFAQSTAFKSWDQLLGSNPTSSQQLINKLLSSSFDSAEINVDYRDYSKFVFYGSAEERLKNFKFKVGLIEYYDTLLTTLSSISPSASEVATNYSDVNIKKNAILSGFDGYEKFLYYESGSYETSSYGEFTSATWPKSNSTKPYTLYSVTSSTALNWYDGQLSSASLYDKENVNSLVYLIPEHIRESEQNDSYSTYVNMIGQHFDILWSYVTHLTDISSREESLYKGLSKDLIYNVLRSLGVDAANGFKVEELWLSSLGLNDSGSFTQSGSLQSIPSGDISKETFKRILNNLPYLLKTKGTERGIRALINCYGIPSTVYKIKEFSGPYQYNSKIIDRDNRYRKTEKFTYATVFTTASSINHYIGNPNTGTTELRFKTAWTPTAAATTQSLFYPTGSAGFGLYLYPSGGSTYGVLKNNSPAISISGPFYNGEFWHVAMSTNNSTITLNAIQIKDGVKVYHISASVAQAGSWGNRQSIGYTAVAPITTGFSGSIQEVKFWTIALDSDTIVQHALSPQSTAGIIPVTVDNYGSGYTSLYSRYPLGSTLQNFDRTLNSVYVTSLHPNISATRIATASGFLNIQPEAFTETAYTWYPNIGDNMDISNKIRIEDSSLDGILSSKHSIEKNEFDNYSLDSPKVGVYFSPQDEINEDIADQFSGILLDDFLGDPRDDSKMYYSKLQELRSHYNLKYSDKNSFWKYTKLIENFDASMFYLIKKFLPARSVKLVGLVIQPTLLDRPKIQQREIFSERDDLETNISQLPNEVLGEYDYYDAEPLIIDHVIDSSNDTYNFETGISVNNVLVADINTYSGSISFDIGDISENVEYINDNTAERFFPAGTYNHTYGGCKISSRGFNIPSADTFDGKPVIEFWTVSPNTPKNLLSNTGDIQI